MEIARTGHHADGRAVARDTRGWKPRAQDTTRSARRQCKCTKRLKQETDGLILPQICGRRGKCYSKVNGKKGKMQKTKNKGCATLNMNHKNLRQ